VRLLANAPTRAPFYLYICLFIFWINKMDKLFIYLLLQISTNLIVFYSQNSMQCVSGEAIKSHGNNGCVYCEVATNLVLSYPYFSSLLFFKFVGKMLA
jgi:hypothetical protein